MAERLEPGDQDVLLVVDVQNDFCPGGALAVPDGDRVVPVINRVAAAFAHVLATQDWHPERARILRLLAPGPRRRSRRSRSPMGPRPCGRITACRAPRGAAFHPDLALDRCELVIRKGFRRAIDSYSAFFENDRDHRHRPRRLSARPRDHAGGLRRARHRLLRELHRDRRRRARAFQSVVIEDGCRAIDLDGSLAAARAAMAAAGVAFVTSDRIGG